MKHGSIVLFDHALRKAWFSNAPFPVSAALHVSAAIGTQLRAYQVTLCNGTPVYTTQGEPS